MENRVIIQARMGSSRLPGKSMQLIGDRPMLWYLLKAVKEVFSESEIVIATSEHSENDPIRQLAHDEGVGCYSGDENNVASRYYAILKDNQTDKGFMFRICGDSPYYDPEILRTGLSLVEEDNYDLVSSMPNKGYPMGCNLEVVRISDFLRGYEEFSESRHFEHVMPYFYDHMDSFQHALISCDYPEYSYDRFKFSVDDQEDFERATRMLEAMSFVPWKFSVLEKMKLLETI